MPDLGNADGVYYSLVNMEDYYSIQVPSYKYPRDDHEIERALLGLTRIPYFLRCQPEL